MENLIIEKKKIEKMILDVLLGALERCETLDELAGDSEVKKLSKPFDQLEKITIRLQKQNESIKKSERKKEKLRREKSKEKDHPFFWDTKTEWLFERNN